MASLLHAKVKSVLSGDTLILTAVNNPKSERTLSLAFVSAPRIRREGDEVSIHHGFKNVAGAWKRSLWSSILDLCDDTSARPYANFYGRTWLQKWIANRQREFGAYGFSIPREIAIRSQLAMARNCSFLSTLFSLPISRAMLTF